jgi:prolyl-tRNA synthetase
MKLSQLFTKTSKEIPADETSKNAQLLIRAGFVHKTMAGVYAYLPLGLRVLNKIENIVRKHLNQIGAQEIFMNSLHPKAWWDQTERWDTVDVLFKLNSQTDNVYALAPTHEEQVTPILKSYIRSWKDLPDYVPGQNWPLSVYQLQTKFRDELRSKAGLMRGREFRMKDMYDLHATKESQERYFELVTETYHAIYHDLGLKSYAVDASGGSFSDKFSREFQVICEAGEDVIKYSPTTDFACNIEVYDEIKSSGRDIPADLKEAKSAEVGNIFDLGQKWVKAFNLEYLDKNNQVQYPFMGCHGIGTSRCMGVIAEIYSDEVGLKWPESVAPFNFHLISQINEKDGLEINSRIQSLAEDIYSGKTPLTHGLLDEVLWDDRPGLSIGQKLTEAELIGCPKIFLITKRSLENGGVEVKDRATGESKIISLN